MSGRLALIFDDGYATDATEIRPVLETHDAPACFAIVTEWVGDDGHLDREQLRGLSEVGCDVIAHGRRHRVLRPHRLAADAAAGDRRLAIASHVFPDDHAGVLPGDTYELTDGARTERVEVSGKRAGSDAPQVELAAPLERDWGADETVFRLSNGVLREEIVGSRKDLVEMGFDPTTFVFPYDAADVRSLGVAREAYEAIPDAAVRSLPNPPGTPAWNLRRYYLETDQLTRVEIEEYLDAVAAEGGLGILAGHSDWETVPPERVAFVIEAARERGVDVTTVRDAVGPDGTV